jgi:hypothetical protein
MGERWSEDEQDGDQEAAHVDPYSSGRANLDGRDFMILRAASSADHGLA